MRRRYLLGTLALAALAVPLMAQTSLWPASKVSVTGLTQTTVQGALTNGEIPVVATSLDNLKCVETDGSGELVSASEACGSGSGSPGGALHDVQLNGGVSTFSGLDTSGALDDHVLTFVASGQAPAWEAQQCAAGDATHQSGAGAPSGIDCANQYADRYTDTTNDEEYYCETTGTPGTWTQYVGGGGAASEIVTFSGSLNDQGIDGSPDYFYPAAVPNGASHITYSSNLIALYAMAVPPGKRWTLERWSFRKFGTNLTTATRDCDFHLLSTPNCSSGAVTHGEMDLLNSATTAGETCTTSDLSNGDANHLDSAGDWCEIVPSAPAAFTGCLHLRMRAVGTCTTGTTVQGGFNFVFSQEDAP